MQGDGLVVELRDGRRSDLAAALVGAGLRLETIMATQRLEDAFLDLLAAGDCRRRPRRGRRCRRDRPGPHRVHQGGAANPHAGHRLLLVGLPTLIVVAINARGNRVDRGDNGEGLFRLAQQSGLLVPAAVLSVMSGFLLVVIAGTLAGDSVAGDAAWGNLRYLLMRPVSARPAARGQGVRRRRPDLGCDDPRGARRARRRGRALRRARRDGARLGDLAAAAPRRLSARHRTLLAPGRDRTGYVAFGFTALLALGTLFSTLTDTAAGAIGATVGVYIVSEILDGISQLGEIRYGFPTHYLDAWQTMFTENRYSHDMVAGIIVQLAYLAVFGAAADRVVPPQGHPLLTGGLRRPGTEGRRGPGRTSERLAGDLIRREDSQGPVARRLPVRAAWRQARRRRHHLRPRSTVSHCKKAAIVERLHEAGRRTAD